MIEMQVRSLFDWRWRLLPSSAFSRSLPSKGLVMNNIVYIVGAVVIVIAILSFFGLR